MSIRCAQDAHVSRGAPREANIHMLPERRDHAPKEDVRSLLNEVEAQSACLERVNAAKKRIQQKFNIPDFPALSENASNQA